MGFVRGLLLDESLLLADDEHGDPFLPPRSARLLRRLQYSKLRVGICHQEDLSSRKANFLGRTAALYSLECISMNPLFITDSLNKKLPALSGSGETCFYVASGKSNEPISELKKLGWKIIYQSVDSLPTTNKDVLLISQLEELPFILSGFNKKEDDNLIVVGYVMKPSREEDFAKRGAFPMCPTQNGLMFVPLTLELPLEVQMKAVDAILHKATDEIISIDMSSSVDLPKGISFSGGMCELERYFRGHPECCIVDPLGKIYPLLDRLKIQGILLGLEDLNIKNHNKIRGPHFMKLDSLQDSNIGDLLLQSKLSFPVILKPQVACGVADAHNMALVFKLEDFQDLSVPLPAIAQEYVDHGSLLFKFYVLGDKVFYAIKKSMPNANVLVSSSEKTGFSPLQFNSLKSLPVAKEDQPSSDVQKISEQSLDLELVHQAANWLRTTLGLTIIGFDVVIQEDSGDHVIVDLNYLPSFKEIPDCDAIPAFFNAIKHAYELWKTKLVTKNPSDAL
ncbi:inositol-tetrakisphosphate 1-kinase 6 isoform X1 [Dioscorea cayenensis subsp. rotundata]|uniref:Inositol-tetrakisphosphate 1-kinase 6 n=2 Tax=Dioscorea cayennensis subsp. rotundata TaxID=55577 RepID=A0AB40ART0_DIOCR|nr:inositol-tetrakisphosphate 1-kinase 6 isoform X1 [Dioscorea cayenensis subsp. rotundata]